MSIFIYLHGYRVTTLVTGRGGKSYYFPKGLRTKIFTFLRKFLVNVIKLLLSLQRLKRDEGQEKIIK